MEKVTILRIDDFTTPTYVSAKNFLLAIFSLQIIHYGVSSFLDLYDHINMVWRSLQEVGLTTKKPSAQDQGLISFLIRESFHNRLSAEKEETSINNLRCKVSKLVSNYQIKLRKNEEFR